jgi:hypothetical protein
MSRIGLALPGTRPGLDGVAHGGTDEAAAAAVADRSEAALQDRARSVLSSSESATSCVETFGCASW